MVKASLVAYTKTLSKSLIKKKIYIHCVLLGAFEYQNNSFEWNVVEREDWAASWKKYW